MSFAIIRLCAFNANKEEGGGWEWGTASFSSSYVAEGCTESLEIGQEITMEQ